MNLKVLGYYIHQAYSEMLKSSWNNHNTITAVLRITTISNIEWTLPKSTIPSCRKQVCLLGWSCSRLNCQQSNPEVSETWLAGHSGMQPKAPDHVWPSNSKIRRECVAITTDLKCCYIDCDKISDNLSKLLLLAFWLRLKVTLHAFPKMNGSRSLFDAWLMQLL